MAEIHNMRGLLIEPLKGKEALFAIWAEDVIDVDTNTPNKALYYQVFGSIPRWDFSQKQVVDIPLRANYPNAIPLKITQTQTGGLIIWMYSFEGVYTDKIIDTGFTIDGDPAVDQIWEYQYLIATPDHENPGKYTFVAQSQHAIILDVLDDITSDTIRNAPPVILEICESAETNPVSDKGAICVEYERDSSGRIVLDSYGRKTVATDGPGNHKIGSLVLSFQADYFGTGKHAFVGGEGSDHFKIYQNNWESFPAPNGIADPDDPPSNPFLSTYWRLFRVKRGYIFQQITANNDDGAEATSTYWATVPDPGQFLCAESTTTYFWLRMTTSGRTVTGATIQKGTSLWPNFPNAFDSSYHYKLLASVLTSDDATHAAVITQYWLGDLFFIPDDPHPFAPLPAPPSDPPDAADTRTLVVHAGLLNGLNPANDDSYGSPDLIVIDADATNYKVWIECTIDSATGSVTAVNLDWGLDGWAVADGDDSDFPDQPDPSGTDNYPIRFYVRLFEVTTVGDVITGISVYRNTSLTVAGYVSGFNCNAANAFTFNLGVTEA